MDKEEFTMLFIRSKTKLFWVLYILFALLFTSISCSKREAPIVVVPGKSIAGIELGMSRKKVISVLGKPTEETSSKDIGQMGVLRVLGGGTIKGEMPQMTILVYSSPPLFVVLHEDNKVGALQLNYTDSVQVEGYDFLKFKYLTKEEVECIGKPSSVIRDKESEQKMLSIAPKETKIEYYVYVYDQPGLVLGLLFDRTKEQSSKYFIGLHFIAFGRKMKEGDYE